MDTEYNETNLGDISVNNDVIKSIALKAAQETKGVYMLGKGILGKIKDSVTRKDSASGVKLEFAGSSDLKIILKLSVDFGVNIPDAASAVQENVKKAVEYMTGINVTEVIVKIVEIQRGGLK